MTGLASVGKFGEHDHGLPKPGNMGRGTSLARAGVRNRRALPGPGNGTDEQVLVCAMVLT